MKFGASRRSYRLFCSYATLGQAKGWKPTSPTPPTQAFELGMHLLTASVVKTLSESGTRKLNDHSIPLAESLVLQVLSRSSLHISKKLDFFYWCSQIPAFKHSAATYSQMLRILCRSNNGGLPWVHDARHLLGSMKQDGITMDASTLQLLLDAFIKSDNLLAAMEILDQMHNVGASLNSRIYNSVIVVLVRKNQLGLAVSMLIKLLDGSNGSGDGTAPQPLACNVLLVALRRTGMKEQFKAVFLKLREKMVVLDKWGFNICIHAFGCWGDLDMSLSLFKEMKDRSYGSDSHGGPDLCTYNSLIRVLFSVGRAKDALTIFEELKGSGHETDAFTYRMVIYGCARSYRIEDATKVFDEMQLKGFHPDTSVYNSLLDGLFKGKKLTKACQLFEKMMQDGIKASCCTYNILIDGLIKNGRAIAGYTLFQDLKSKGQFVDAITYSIIILHHCREGEFKESLSLVREMESRGFVVDLVTITAMVIELYKQGQWDNIESLMKHVRDNNLLPDVLKWKANVEALLENPPRKRKDFTSIFPHKGGLKSLLNSLVVDSDVISDSLEDPDLGTRLSIGDDWLSSPFMDQLAEEGLSDNHRFPWFSLSKGRRVQGYTMSTFNIDMVNTYLSIFLAKGNLSLACKLFEIFTDEGVGAVTYTYNSIASSFVKKGYFDEVWGILHDMCCKLCPADVATYNVIVQNLGKMGRADLATSVLDRLMEGGGYIDIIMYNTLINALGKAGRIGDAKKLFNQMKSSGVNPDIITFNTLIEVHARAGRLEDAKEFLSMMIGVGLPPNHVTHTILGYLGKEEDKLCHRKASVNCNVEDIVS